MKAGCVMQNEILKLYSKKQAAELMGISLDSLNRMLKRHPLLFPKSTGRLRLPAEKWNKLAEIDAWTSNTTHQGHERETGSGSSPVVTSSQAMPTNRSSNSPRVKSIRKLLSEQRQAS